jgi:hypothetical protein
MVEHLTKRIRLAIEASIRIDPIPFDERQGTDGDGRLREAPIRKEQGAVADGVFRSVAGNPA